MLQIKKVKRLKEALEELNSEVWEQLRSQYPEVAVFLQYCLCLQALDNVAELKM